MRKIVTIAAALFAVMVMFSGCYTILRHPVAEESYTAEDYQADCLGCHDDYHDYPYGYFYGDYPDYWWTTPRWGRYYAYPWWWDNYWYSGGYDHSQDYREKENDVRSSSGQKMVRRDALRPPYTTSGTTTISRGGSMPATVTDGGSTGSTSTGSTPPTSTTRTNSSNDTKKDDETDNTKTTRRGSGKSR